MTSGRVIVLNGTSSAGKSTVLRQIQDQATSPWLDLGLDRLLTTLPPRYLAAQWQEVFRYSYDDAGTIQRIETAPVGDRLARAMHRAIAAVASDGTDVVAEHVVLSAEWAADLVDCLSGVRVLLVGLRCPLEVTEDRERGRGNRTLGQARAQFDAVHRWLPAAAGGYDLEVDTSVASAADCARAVLHAVTKPA